MARDEQPQLADKEENKKDLDAVTYGPAKSVPSPVVISETATPMAMPPPPPQEPSYASGRVDRAAIGGARLKAAVATPAPAAVAPWTPAQAVSAGEKYAAHDDNPVQRTAENPVSTFSIDVDTGSYSNVRRMLNEGQRPPADAVRAEEMINYFDYAYPTPVTRTVPFRVTTEMAPAPWNPKHTLLQIGIKGYEVPRTEIPPANLVFLIDTSGSMDEPNKLPLLKQAFAQLVPNLRAQDRVAIVVYAGSAGLVLPTTPGDHHAEILAALDRLEAGGSTNGAAGIGLAYAQARGSFIKGGANRIILATDGDFNVGVSDVGSLKEMVAKERESGVALTTLGFGEGNYHDTMAEQLADIGDGNHAYIDTLNEAKKVFVEEMGATLLTIAKDVKIQMEFNPSVVSEYRLIGYEDRALRREDFNNDKIDAGEIGAGHNVTALYELSLTGSGADANDPLRYGKPVATTGRSGEIGLLRLRYKQPDASVSKLIETPLQRNQLATTASPRLRFAAAVAAYADKLRGGKHINGYSWTAIDALARGTGGVDRWGYRAEFEQLVDKARALDEGTAPVATAR
jgi:Ca-activated chloride channel family protein